MELARTKAVKPEFTESLSLLELDLEGESFHATFDSARDSTSLAVIAVVATALEVDPEALTPLQTVIDTDALDKLVTESTTDSGAFGSISFRYDGFEITVTSEDDIEATPTGDT